MSDRPRLIQCIGNPLRRDDGAGPEVARRLRASPPANTLVSEHWGEGAELMQSWPGHDRVILVDAAASGAAAGTLHRFDAHRQSIPSDFLCYSTHRFGVAEAIELARVLGTLPAALTLYAIEGETFAEGEGLTPAVVAAVEQLVERLLDRSP